MTGKDEFATVPLLDPTAVCLTCLCLNNRSVPATLQVRHTRSGEAMPACVDCDADGMAAESIALYLARMAQPFQLTKDGTE